MSEKLISCIGKLVIGLFLQRKVAASNIHWCRAKRYNFGVFDFSRNHTHRVR
jgi:hypothetical protein